MSTLTRQDIGAAVSRPCYWLVLVGEEEGIGDVRDVDGRLLFHPEQTGTGGFGIPAPVITASLL